MTVISDRNFIALLKYITTGSEPIANLENRNLDRRQDWLLDQLGIRLFRLHPNANNLPREMSIKSWRLP